MRVYFETYGCWLNKAETEVMEDLVSSRDHILVDDPKDADVIVINTCAVRAETEAKMLYRIRSLMKLGKRLIIAGCLASARPGLLSLNFPNASLLAPEALEAIVELIEGDERKVIIEERPRLHLPKYKAYKGMRHVVPIATGCLGRCTFCIGKIARPRLRSYDLRDIVHNVIYAVRGGAREIYLSAQDAAAYGWDRGTNLAELIGNILRCVKGNYRIRIGMMEPFLLKRIIGRLLPLYADPRMYKYAHIPVQSGDDRILELMGRKYKAEEYVELIRTLRDEYPLMSITTDVIVGFPGEDGDAFRRTCELIERIEPDKVNIARYGVRPGTPASSMKQIPEDVKRRRSAILTRLAMDIKMRRNKANIGRRGWALIIDSKRGKGLGRLDNYKLVILKGIQDLNVGDFVEVKIINASRSFLIGEIL